MLLLKYFFQKSEFWDRLLLLLSQQESRGASHLGKRRNLRLNETVAPSPSINQENQHSLDQGNENLPTRSCKKRKSSKLYCVEITSDGEAWTCPLTPYPLGLGYFIFYDKRLSPEENKKLQNIIYQRIIGLKSFK